MIIGFGICFSIRPDLLSVATAFSDFGNDVRTAPYFAASVFIGAYGLWRWRNYLGRTLKNPMPMYGLISITILGLYMVALMPISWEPWPRRVHIAGLTLAGLSMLATVVVDGLISKSPKSKDIRSWQMIRLVSFITIILGGWVTLGSIKELKWYNASLLGECLMLFGYTLWVSTKTYQGEGRQTVIARLLRKIIMVK